MYFSRTARAHRVGAAAELPSSQEDEGAADFDKNGAPAYDAAQLEVQALPVEPRSYIAPTQNAFVAARLTKNWVVHWGGKADARRAGCGVARGGYL